MSFDEDLAFNVLLFLALVLPLYLRWSFSENFAQTCNSWPWLNISKQLVSFHVSKVSNEQLSFSLGLVGNGQS